MEGLCILCNCSNVPENVTILQQLGLLPTVNWYRKFIESIDVRVLKALNTIDFDSIYNESMTYIQTNTTSSFELDVALNAHVSVIPLQQRSCFVYMSFVRLGHHNESAWPQVGNSIKCLSQGHSDVLYSIGNRIKVLQPFDY